MNRALPEMLNCLNMPGNVAGVNGGTDVSVLERQQARMKWQQDQIRAQEQCLFNGNEINLFSIQAQAQQFPGMIGNDASLEDFMACAVKPDPGMENGWPDFGKFGGDDHLGYGNVARYGNVAGFGMNHTLLSMASCQPAVVELPVADGSKGNQPVLQGNLSLQEGRQSFKKRKADKAQSRKAITVEEENREKKIKGCSEEGDSKITQQYSNGNNRNNTATTNDKNNNNNNNGETSTDTSSKGKSKVTEVQKQDYIHVRARRGQATDSHSLAERVRREKISERMKYLQDLVPGCNKITGKAGMLDEIINYVQSLQKQVEFLSMKLVTVNPRLDVNIDNFFTNEMFQSATTSFPAIGASPETANHTYFQLNALPQMVSCCGLEMEIDPSDVALRRTISAPVLIPDTYIDSYGYNQIQPTSNWDAELENLYGMEFQQGRSTTTFPSQPFTGSSEGGNLKMEM